MIYLPEELIWHIMSFFDITISVEIYYYTIITFSHKAIEILFLSMTNKYLNTVVKKYSNDSKLTPYSVQEYYFNSINNFNMILELESLNMRTIPYGNMNYFWLKISKNPELLMYLHHNQLYFRMTYSNASEKSGLMLGSVKYLLSNINDEKLIFFLQRVEDDLERKLEDEDNYTGPYIRFKRDMRFEIFHKTTELNIFIIENQINPGAINLASENEHIQILKWFKNSNYEFKCTEDAIVQKHIELLQWNNKQKKNLKKFFIGLKKKGWVKKSNFKPSKFKNTRR